MTPELTRDEKGQAGRRGGKGRLGGGNSTGKARMEGSRGAPRWGGSRWSSCRAARLPRDGDLASQWLPEATMGKTDPSRCGRRGTWLSQGQLQREAGKQRS